MTEVEIDVRGETCPVPLVEFRKALRKASSGDELVVIGNHPASKVEIPMASEVMGLEVINIEEKNDEWKIRVKK